MKNAAFWDIKTHFVPHRRHITSPLQSTVAYCYVRFEVFTAVTMKNAAFWDIKTHFVPHRRHITSPLQSTAAYCYVRFEVFKAVTMKNVVFWDATPCGSCKSRRFGETYRLHHHGDKNRRATNNIGSN
jgi:hypothetical protein